MKEKRFYIDDVPVAKDMSEWPPELHLDENGNPKPKAPPAYEMFDTAPMIRHMRTSRGLSQRQLAERLGRVPSCISELETRTGSATFATMARIARACGYEIIFRKKEKVIE